MLIIVKILDLQDFKPTTTFLYMSKLILLLTSRNLVLQEKLYKYNIFRGYSMKRACLNTFLVMYIINGRFIIVYPEKEKHLIFKELYNPPQEESYIITDKSYSPPSYVADVLNNLDDYLKNGVYIGSKTPSD